MPEFKVEGLDAVLLATAIDQKRQIEGQANQISRALETRLRELNGELPDDFMVRVEGGAVVAFWEELDKPDDVPGGNGADRVSRKRKVAAEQ